MIYLVDTAFRIYEVIIIIRVLFSWIRVDPYHPVAQWVYRLTEPLLDPIRRVLPTAQIGIDFSPLVLLLAMEFLQRLLLRLLYSF
jgi:YggT family protein